MSPPQETVCYRIGELAGPRSLHPRTQADDPEGWHLREVDAAGAIRADYLIVARVNHKYVWGKFGHLTRDLVDDMGIDSDDPRVDDLDRAVRVSGVELGLKLGCESELGRGHALSCRFSEHDNPDGVGRLSEKEPEVERPKVEASRQEQAYKPGILRK